MAKYVKSLKYIDAGGREILKSSGVRSLLSQQGEAAASRCNALCSSSMKKAGARYDCEIVERSYVAAARVHVSGEEDGKFALIDNYRNNTLKKGCGV